MKKQLIVFMVSSAIFSLILSIFMPIPYAIFGGTVIGALIAAYGLEQQK